uniref:Uncharacterized protein n=1 Tax=Anguilla anguilla TaxID=7936 RepID=A0A0E9Q001_ANGAN
MLFTFVEINFPNAGGVMIANLSNWQCQMCPT